MKKKINVEDAVGLVLAHDLTKIVPGEFKGAAYKKGHIITPEDVDVLKDMGKYHIYALELSEDILHEEEAARRIGNAILEENVVPIKKAEGKVEFEATCNGLLKIDKEKQLEANLMGELIISTLKSDYPVRKGQIVGGTRIIPLTMEATKIKNIEKLCEESGFINVKPFSPLKVGLIITGTEVYEGRITDKFGPVLSKKVMEYGGCVQELTLVPDDQSRIEKVLDEYFSKELDLIILAGGMSVDPDDLTPSAIRAASDEVISYGAPVLPGAMFMLAYKNDKPIIGMPACGMFFRTTVLDLMLPHLFINEPITKRMIASMGNGGYCLGCSVCKYPNCTFGK